jgi:hypothetical protein
MIEMGIDHFFSLHLLVKEKIIAGSKISLFKGILGSSMTKENMVVLSLFRV